MGMLPQGYKPPKSSDKYFKPQNGENRIRILSEPIMGTEGWTLPDEKHKKGLPVRVPMDVNFPPDSDIDPKVRPKHWWALAIWDYADSKVKVWNVTQGTIQDAITAYDNNAKWGDVRGYDLAITRSGTMLETEYSVIAEPKTKLDTNIEDAWERVKAAGFNLSALFTNGDPFGSVDAESAVAFSNSDPSDPF